VASAAVAVPLRAWLLTPVSAVSMSVDVAVAGVAPGVPVRAALTLPDGLTVADAAVPAQGQTWSVPVSPEGRVSVDLVSADSVRGEVVLAIQQGDRRATQRLALDVGAAPSRFSQILGATRAPDVTLVSDGPAFTGAPHDLALPVARITSADLSAESQETPMTRSVRTLVVALALVAAPSAFAEDGAPHDADTTPVMTHDGEMHGATAGDADHAAMHDAMPGDATDQAAMHDAMHGDGGGMDPAAHMQPESADHGGGMGAGMGAGMDMAMHDSADSAGRHGDGAMGDVEHPDGGHGDAGAETGADNDTCDPAMHGDGAGMGDGQGMMNGQGDGGGQGGGGMNGQGGGMGGR